MGWRGGTAGGLSNADWTWRGGGVKGEGEGQKQEGEGQKQDVYQSCCCLVVLPGRVAGTLVGEDSEGADSGRLRGGTGGGMAASSEVRLKLTIEETEDDPETKRVRTG